MVGDLVVDIACLTAPERSFCALPLFGKRQHRCGASGWQGEIVWSGSTPAR